MTLTCDQRNFIHTFKALDSPSISDALTARFGASMTPGAINSLLQGAGRDGALKSSMCVPEIVLEYIFNYAKHYSHDELSVHIFDRFGYKINAVAVKIVCQENNLRKGGRPSLIDWEVSEAIFHCASAGMTPLEIERALAEHLRVFITEKRILAHLRRIMLGAFL